MRKLFILFVGVFVFVSSAHAQDGVYVDLSVLNSLGNGQAAARSGPRFPVVQREPRVSQPRAAKPKPKAVVTKIEARPIVVEERVEAIQIPEKVSIETQPEAEAPETVEEAVAVETESLFNDTDAAENADPLSTIEDHFETSVIHGEDDEERPITPQEAELLIPADEEPEPEPQTARISDNRIHFAEGDAGLSDVKKTLIDSIVAQFRDPVNNKIAITSYNFDTGEDTFRKKRISLNRAVEIRSYLLGKGFKNFSIKVINVTDDETKKDLVEISEL